MATSPCSSSGVSSSSSSGLGADAGLEIRTRSVEQTLVPLVSQVEMRFPALPLPGPARVARLRPGAGAGTRDAPLPQSGSPQGRGAVA